MTRDALVSTHDVLTTNVTSDISIADYFSLISMVFLPHVPVLSVKTGYDVNVMLCLLIAHAHFQVF